MFRFIVVGKSTHGKVLERWHCRWWGTVLEAQQEMQHDPTISRVVVISLCQLCGHEMRQKRCLNPKCDNHPRVALPAPELAASHV